MPYCREVQQYFNSLSDAAKKTISVSRVAVHLRCSYEESGNLLEEYVRDGKLVKYNVLCCPECGYIIKTVNEEEHIRVEQCVHCGAQINADDEDYEDCIKVRYALVKTGGP